MNEQSPKPPAEQNNEPAAEHSKRGKAAMLATGAVLAGGLLAERAVLSDDNTEPVQTQDAAVVDEAQPDQYEKSLSADPKEVEITPKETTTTTEVPATAVTPEPEISEEPFILKGEETPEPEISEEPAVAENPDAPEFKEQQNSLRDMLNPKVGAEFTCVLGTRGLDAGRVVYNLRNEPVMLKESVNVLNYTIASSAAREGEQSVHGAFFINVDGQELYDPLTPEEVTDLYAGACEVVSLDANGRVQSFKNEEGAVINQSALVAVPRT